MSTRTNLHRLALASAIAAMLAAAAPGTFAQTADTPTPAAPAAPPAATPPGTNATTTDAPGTTVPSPAPTVPSTPDSTAPTPGMSGSTAPMPMSSTPAASDPSNLPTDYKILNNRYFDGVNLQQARARGLSDSEIASIVRIAKLTGYPFDTIAASVERGATFPQIATDNNLKLSDVYNVDKEKQEVSDYDALSKYASSLGKSDSMSAMPMSSPSTSMPPAAPGMSPAAMPGSSTTSSATPTLDIVDTAMAAKNLTTLVKALQVAGLVETLKGAGPFTVFAPDNKAFAKLPAGALDALLADPAKLKQVLTYHVIPANIMASDALAVANSVTPTSPPTVEGATLQVTKGKKGRLKVNDATITKADIPASNGTIHVIDAVLMPPTDSATPATPPTDTTSPAPAPMDATPPTPPAAPDPNAAPAAPAPAAPAPDPNAAPAAPAPDPNAAPAPATPGATPTPGQ